MKVLELFNGGKLTEHYDDVYGSWIDTKRNTVYPIKTEDPGHPEFIYDNPELFGITPDTFEDELVYDQDIYRLAYTRGWVRVVYPTEWNPRGVTLYISGTEQSIKKAWPKLRPHTTRQQIEVLIEFYPKKKNRTFILPRDRGKMIEFFTM